MNSRSIILSAVLLPALYAAAQFDQTIAVEGKYIPEVIRLDRINTFPRQERFQLETTPLAYDSKGIPASFAPSLYAMPASGWRDSRTTSAQRGYLEFGLGSWLNSTLSAGYRFLSDENSSVGVRFQHNSTSLWQPDLSDATADIHQWRYDEALGIYGSHRFAGAGTLDAAIDYHIGNFNYYGYLPYRLLTSSTAPTENSLKAPTQTLNDVSARLGWQSESSTDDLSWNVALGARYFGYRSMYAAPLWSDILQQTTKASRETDINLAGNLNFPTSSKSAVGLDLHADLLTYSGGMSAQSELSIKPETYGLITLTPYYRFSIDRFNLRLGVDVDIAAHQSTKDRVYSTFNYDALHFAPDVMVDFDGGLAQIFLRLQGGSRLHTLASGAELDYYQQPTLLNTTPVYTPLDGEFGVSFGPFSGFSAGVGFAFRVSRGEYTGGWYQQRINSFTGTLSDALPMAGLPSQAYGLPVEYSLLDQETYNIHGYSLRANMRYDYGDLFGISLNGSYQPQNGTKGYFNGLDRPRWIAEAVLSSNPWKPLKLSLAYRYRGVRNAYTVGQYVNDNGLRENFLTSMRLPDVTSLDFGASYSFTDSFAVWLQADNLLNRKIDLLPGQPSQGIVFTGGLSVVF